MERQRHARPRPEGIPDRLPQSEDVARAAQNLADSMVNCCGFDRVNIAASCECIAKLMIIPIPFLVRKRHELADLTYHRIVEHGRKQVSKAAQLLFAGEEGRRLETTFEMAFEVLAQDYT